MMCFSRRGLSLLVACFTATHCEAFMPPVSQRHVGLQEQSLFSSKFDIMEKITQSSSSLPSPKSSDPTLVQGDLVKDLEQGNDFDKEYQKGILTIGFITLLNASLAPVWHTVFASGNGPPPLFLNAVVSIVALIGLLVGGSFLDNNVESTSALADSEDEKWSMKSFRGGIELGFWKGLGT